jgi:hypothetical protein
LTRKSQAPASLTAPPSGLFLERVFYEKERAEYPLVPLLSVGRGEPG